MTMTQTPTPSDLAALIAARLCHDLVSPVSALGAALSVLDDENAEDMRDDAIELVRTGAQQARAKLEYCRLAFGAGGSAPAVIDAVELKRLANDMFADHKPDLVWKMEASGLDKPAARILLNLIWIAVDSVPRGGSVTIEATSSEGGARLKIVSAGPRVRLDPAYVDAMSGKSPQDGFDGRSIQPYYAGLIARENGGRVDAEADEERAVFTALVARSSQVAA